MKNFLLILSLAIGILLCVDAIVLLTFTQSFSNILLLCLGVVFILIDLYYNKFGRWLQKLVKVTMAVAIPICVFMMGLIIVKGCKDSTTFTEDYVIVLGAGIKDDRILLSLQKRLDKCIEYMAINPNATIIVSGGQGRGESISEALAMERYLIANGIDRAKIIKEDQSSDTYENFKYSKVIIDSLSANTSAKITTVFITNDFHIYRSGRLAKLVGIEVTNYNADLPLYLRPPTYLREILSIFKFWVYR